MRRLAALLVIAALALTACDDKATPAAQPPPGAPAAPAPLAKVAGESSVEGVLRDLVKAAAQHAAGAPAGDRSPEVVVTSGSACGVKVKAITCPPSGASDKVTITVNPALTWQQYQQQPGHGGGDTPVQNAALGAVVQYLAYREMQRTDPSLLSTTLSDDAKTARVAQIMMCKNGEVYAGLHTVMPPELAQTWQANALGKQGEYFTKGQQGAC